MFGPTPHSCQLVRILFEVVQFPFAQLVEVDQLGVAGCEALVPRELTIQLRAVYFG
jgi:hypothetical protein